MLKFSAVTPALPASRARRGRGFTLLELMVGLSIVAISLAIVAPGFAGWIQNSRVRSYAESMQNAVQFARAEAVRRNTPVTFQITSTLDNTCSVVTTGNYWVVSAGSTNAASACGTLVSDPTSSTISAASSGPFILKKGPPETSLNGASLTATQSAITFNGLGRQTADSGAAVALTTYQITSTNGTCVAAGGAVRCLNIVVSPAGQMRMCDPSLTSTATNNDPMAC
ncbi:MAG: GspH/FimT family pseudopilin [Rhodoferax sp.]|nr:GspH/FimT family pseudopilin [Rhodoferax sp.]